MTRKQNAARVIMLRFIEQHGGTPDQLYRVRRSYRWRAPDGKVAAVGWEE